MNKALLFIESLTWVHWLIAGVILVAIFAVSGTTNEPATPETCVSTYLTPPDELTYKDAGCP